MSAVRQSDFYDRYLGDQSGPPNGAVSQLLTKYVQHVLILLKDKTGQGQTKQQLALHAQHCCHCQVGLSNVTLLIDRAIAHRCQVVKIEVARLGCVKLSLGAAQLVALNLRLDMV
jgi:hypothetical protein